MKRLSTWLAAWAALAAGLAVPATSLGQDGSQGSVLVLAAASTGNAVDDIRREFTKETAVEVRSSYAASSTLARQVVNGAEADVFLSADLKWADYLTKQGYVAQRQNLLGNRLVVIVPLDSPLKLAQPADLAAAALDHLALGDPETVPAGIYARQALTKLGIWERLKPKIAAADSVRQALAYVETGAAEAGIVYATDAALSTKVKVAVAIPADLTEPIVYPVALLKHGAGRRPAEAFYRYLSSPAAAKVFEKYGFKVLDAAPPAAPAAK
jgi:molybdate transport system substrate-binding protein